MLFLFFCNFLVQPAFLLPAAIRSEKIFSNASICL